MDRARPIQVKHPGGTKRLSSSCIWATWSRLTPRSSKPRDHSRRQLTAGLDPQCARHLFRTREVVSSPRRLNLLHAPPPGPARALHPSRARRIPRRGQLSAERRRGYLVHRGPGPVIRHQLTVSCYVHMHVPPCDTLSPSCSGSEQGGSRQRLIRSRHSEKTPQRKQTNM